MATDENDLGTDSERDARDGHGAIAGLPAVRQARELAHREEATRRATEFAQTARGLAIARDQFERLEREAIDDALGLSDDERAELDELQKASRADSTRRQQARFWAQWEAFAAARGVPSMPAHPRAVAAFVLELHRRGLRASTISAAVSTISSRHADASVPFARKDAELSRTLAGVSRKSPPATRKTPIMRDQLAAMLATIPADTLKGKRDRALLLFGWYTAMRRSEITALVTTDLTWQADGADVLIRRSKGDQTGIGRSFFLPKWHEPSLCPVVALRAWMRAAGVRNGHVFRAVRGSKNTVARDGRLDDKAVADVVKAAAAAVGLDPSVFGGHSMRSGHAVQASDDAVPTADIQAQLGHKSMNMTARYAQKSDNRKRSTARQMSERQAALAGKPLVKKEPR